MKASSNMGMFMKWLEARWAELIQKDLEMLLRLDGQHQIVETELNPF
jgi:hypothetical protein